MPFIVSLCVRSRVWVFWSVKSDRFFVRLLLLLSLLLSARRKNAHPSCARKVFDVFFFRVSGPFLLFSCYAQKKGWPQSGAHVIEYRRRLSPPHRRPYSGQKNSPSRSSKNVRSMLRNTTTTHWWCGFCRRRVHAKKSHDPFSKNPANNRLSKRRTVFGINVAWHNVRCVFVYFIWNEKRIKSVME